MMMRCSLGKALVSKRWVMRGSPLSSLLRKLTMGLDVENELCYFFFLILVV